MDEDIDQFEKASVAVLRSMYGVSVDFYGNINGNLERVRTIAYPKEMLDEIAPYFKKNICIDKESINTMIGLKV